MKLFSKQTGELTIAHQLPPPMKQYEVPASSCYYIRSRFGHLIFQEIYLEEIIVRFTDIIPEAAENAFLQDEILLIEEQDAIVFSLSLTHSHHYHIDGLGDIAFHERGFNMYAIPPMVSSFVVGKTARSELKLFLTLPFAEQLATSETRLYDLLKKFKKHKPATLTRYNQVATWGLMDLTDRLKQDKHILARNELVAHLLRSTFKISNEETIRKPSLLTQQDRESLYAIKNKLFSNLDKTFTKEQMLDEYPHLKKYKLEKGFREMYGKSAFALLTEQRMKVAANLLQDERDLTIMEIATETGYSDPSPFVKAFYRFFGLYPDRFRQNQKKNL
jgi:AraC-like DNA-binding protein